MTDTPSTLSYETVKARAFTLAQHFIDLGFIKADGDWTVHVEDIASAAKPVTFPAMLSVLTSNPGIEAVRDPSICNLMLVIEASISEQIKRDAHQYLETYFSQH